MTGSSPDVDGVLLDIDGVLTVDWQPLPGAVATIERLRAAGLPFRFLTNTTSRTRVALSRALGGAGIACKVDEIVSAPEVVAAQLQQTSFDGLIGIGLRRRTQLLDQIDRESVGGERNDVQDRPRGGG